MFLFLRDTLCCIILTMRIFVCSTQTAAGALGNKPWICSRRSPLGLRDNRFYGSSCTINLLEKNAQLIWLVACLISKNGLENMQQAGAGSQIRTSGISFMLIQMPSFKPPQRPLKILLKSLIKNIKNIWNIQRTSQISSRTSDTS